MSDAKPAPTLSRNYAIRVTDGNVYAVEWADDWIPVRLLGPIDPSALGVDPDALDWSTAADARGENAANYVDLCDAERRLRLDGVTRGSTLNRRSAARALPPRGVTERPDLDRVKAQARALGL